MTRTALGPIEVLTPYADQQLVERLGIEIAVREPAPEDPVTAPGEGRPRPVWRRHCTSTAS
ncbi:hypothetical protein ABZ876_05715 [Streptomyces sp. NPDC046931]|uniref:hypothetical protein n=1 Tax=Streptomyces sp. NPDC046931 TaxID=3154806 RepID=UPI0033E1D4F0